MFDDLHDPDPPVPEMHTLAGVTQRAKALRRRRWMFTGASAAVLVVAATVGTVISTRDDAGHQLINVSPPPTQPSDTFVTSPTADTTTPTSGATSTTAVVTQTTITGAVQVSSRPIVAIDGAGDAVIIDADGNTTVLLAGPGPDDAPPDEGDSFAIDAVAATSDGSVALVGTCCEPIPGTVVRFALPNVVDSTFAYGHAPAISPDGTLVVTDVLGAISVSDTNLAEIVSTPEDYLGDRSGNGFVWLSNDQFVVLQAGLEDARFQSITLTPDNMLVPGPVYDTGPIDGFALTLAGTGPGVFYVLGLTSSTLTAFDAATLLPSPANDVALPGDARSAWLQDGELRWVSKDNVLHIGDIVMNGEFLWVR